MRFARSLLPAAAVVSGACTRTNVTPLNLQASYARTCPEAIVVYTSTDRVRGEYDEIALLNSSGSTDWTSERGMVTSMRKKAADVGATAIVLNHIQEPSAGAKIAAAVLAPGSAARTGRSVAIFQATDSSRVRGVCSGEGALPLWLSDSERHAWVTIVRPASSDRAEAAIYLDSTQVSLLRRGEHVSFAADSGLHVLKVGGRARAVMVLPRSRYFFRTDGEGGAEQLVPLDSSEAVRRLIASKAVTSPNP